ncbi:MAG: heme transporter HemC [Alphaproteobacteria bacterium]|nr:heme transporter HemC [Alphaproteobacteria bacterium]
MTSKPASFWTRYANPTAFQRLSNQIAPLAGGAAIAFIALGLWFGLVASPADYQQGDTVRIMYVHVPAAWMAMACYTSMAIASVAGFVWKHPLADVAAKSTAPIGATFTALALVTGALWGQPTWGTWWVWDARLTSVLVLFFMYLGYMALWSAIDEPTRAARIAAVACLVGFINVPIIKFSVDWWNSLHQPASVIRANGPSIDGSMLRPLLLMAFGYTLAYVWLLFVNMSAELAERRAARLLAGARPTATLVAEPAE